MKTFSSINNQNFKNINEGFWDKFGASSFKDLFIFAPFKNAFEKASGGAQLSAKEKNNQKWAEAFEKQYNNEIKNQIKHEEDLEIAQQDAAEQMRLNQLEAAEKQKQMARERELAAIRAVTAKLKDKQKAVQNMRGGSFSEEFINQQIAEMEELTDGVIPAEKKLLEDAKSTILSVYYDDEGNFKPLVDSEGDPIPLADALETHFKDNPQLLKELKRNKYFKELEVQTFDSEKDFENFISEHVEKNPSKETLDADLEKKKVYQNQINEQHKETAKLQKDKEAAEKTIKSKKEALSKLEKPTNELIDGALNKDGQPTDNQQFGKKYAQSLVNKIKNTENDEEAAPYLQKLKDLTGDQEITINRDNDEVKIYGGGDSGAFEPDSVEYKEENINNAVKDYAKEARKYEDNKKKLEDEISNAEKTVEELEGKIEQSEKTTKDIIKEYNETVPEDQQLVEDDVEGSVTKINEQAKEAEKKVKEAESRNAKNKEGVKNAIKSRKKNDEEKKYEKELNNLSKEEQEKLQKEKDTIKKGAETGPNGSVTFKMGDEEIKFSAEQMKEIKKDPKKMENFQKLADVNLAMQEIPSKPALTGDPKDDAIAMEKWKTKKESILSAREKLKNEKIPNENGEEVPVNVEDPNSLKKLITKDSKDENGDTVKNPIKDIIQTHGETESKDFEYDDEGEDEEDTEAIDGEDNKDVEELDLDNKSPEEQKEAIEDAMKNNKVNPAKLFKRRKRKDGKGTTRSYYCIKNKEYSLSPEEYKEKMKKYKEAKKSSTETQNEARLISLKRYIFENWDK